ncbi:MAG: site-specific DNA-methyltransferase [Candidatus Coprovivens sp.]
MANKLELTWVGKNELKNIEPRILIEDKSKSYGERNTDNMLIHGDNLLALKALEKDYAGKIKCIYIDPPYNTGSAFEHYDDNLEHSIWLNLMKERLNILNNLLCNNGVICVECDDNEMAYLKILCDEIFGRKNFLNMLVIETGEVFGTKAAHINKTFVKVKDYILVYVKNKNQEFRIKPLWTKTNEVFDTHFSNYIENNHRQSLISFLLEKDWINKIYEKYNQKKTLNNLSMLMNFEPELKRYICEEISSNIYQDQPFTQKIPEEIVEKLKSVSIVEYNSFLLFMTSSGSVRYYKPFSDTLKITDDYINEYTRSTARGDLWKNYHIDMRNIDDEGSVKFKASKKPERLIRDIIYSFSNEGDIILDSFLGSGTTAAVAHKMNRKWIGIEMGEHCYSHCIPRLNSVIDGKDFGGITKNIGWKGGGGYKFYELAPSLIEKDAFEQEIINPKYDEKMLSEAVALHEGFDYEPSNEYYWKQSKGNEKSYLYVTIKFVGEATLDNIKSELKEDEYLIIACTSYDENIEHKYKNIKIKKIPEMLLSQCEYGVDNYDLNVVEEEEVYEDE